MNINLLTSALAIAVVVVDPRPVGAQDASPASALTHLGDRTVAVWVNDRTIELRGRIVDVGSDAVTLHAGAARHDLPFDTIHRIERLGDSPWNGPVIGAAVGAAASVGLWAAEGACYIYRCDDDLEHLTITEAASMSLAFATVGFLVDLFHTGRTVVWLAPASGSIGFHGYSPAGPLPRRASPGVMFGYRRTF